MTETMTLLLIPLCWLAVPVLPVTVGYLLTSNRHRVGLDWATDEEWATLHQPSGMTVVYGLLSLLVAAVLAVLWAVL